MPKIPQVTIGKATAQRPTPKAPDVSIGRVTSVGAPVLTVVRAPGNRNLTLAEAIAQAGSDNPPLVITELTGHGRIIQLSGRALPYKGSLKFTSEQRIDEGEHTGYPRINQTVLGGREMPTEMNGAWKDRFLGDVSGGPQAILQDFVPDGVSVPADSPLSVTSSLLTARDLAELFEDIAYSGRPLRVQWAHLRRTGRLTTFEQNWIDLHDVEWKATFKWMSRDERTGLPSPARTTLTGLASEFRSAATDLHDGTNFDGIDDLDPSFADAIDGLIGTIEGAVSGIGDAIETRISAISDTTDSLRRATTIATYVRDQAQQLIDTLDGVVYPAMLAAQDPTSITPDAFSRDALSDIDLGRSGRLADSLINSDPGASIAAACQNRAAVQLARRMRHVAARQRFAALRQLEADSVGVVVLRDQQDLRDVVLEWYGNSEDWERLRRYNALDTVSPPAGTMIFVPNAGTSS
jgi:hypothetical protein